MTAGLERIIRGRTEHARQTDAMEISDESAEEFCTRMRPRLLGAITLFCGDREVAEDLTQETLARIWVHWPQVRSARSPEAWAHRAGLNLAASAFRRRGAERRARSRLADRRATEGTGLDQADTIAVRRAVAGLSTGQRKVLILRYYSDLSVTETAAVLRCSEGNVKAQTARAIDALRSKAGLLVHEEGHDGR